MKKQKTYEIRYEIPIPKSGFIPIIADNPDDAIKTALELINSEIIIEVMN